MAALLERLTRQGYRIRLLNEQQIEVTPKPPPEMGQHIRQNKAQLLAELKAANHPGPAVLHFKLTPQPGTCPGGTLIDHGGDWAAALRELIAQYGSRLCVESLREFFEERAAISQYDSGTSRDVAEHLAWESCIRLLSEVQTKAYAPEPGGSMIADTERSRTHRMGGMPGSNRAGKADQPMGQAMSERINTMRVDYTPGPAVAEALAAMTDEYPDHNTEALIDQLVIAGASALLHQHWQQPSLHGSNRAKWRTPANIRDVASKVRANTVAVPDMGSK